MKNRITFKGIVQKFPGRGGWVYISVPKKYTDRLKQQRPAWGMYPITVSVGNTTWKTKLMMKKGGDFFIALKAAVRDKEKITIRSNIIVSFKLC